MEEFGCEKRVTSESYYLCIIAKKLKTIGEELKRIREILERQLEGKIE